MKILPNALQHSAGVGLRTQHITDILVSDVDVPWFEILADNWLSTGGLTAHYLDAFKERYPLTLHGVGLSLGGPQPIDTDYLVNIKDLLHRSQALWYSEHLCFCKTGQHVAHDLLPLPYTEEAISHLVQRIRFVQDFLERPIVLENVSSYIQYKQSEMSEVDFIKTIVDETHCHLLLDINNLYVSQRNHGDCAKSFIDDLKGYPIKEVHLAGFEDKGHYVVDAHNNAVAEEVWELYLYFLDIFGPQPTLIEWDNDLPDLDVLEVERKKAQKCLETVL